VLPDVLSDEYRFSRSGLYYAPAEGKLGATRDYIAQLPLGEGPEVFGMHENANIAFELAEGQLLVERVLSMQVRVISPILPFQHLLFALRPFCRVVCSLREVQC